MRRLLVVFVVLLLVLACKRKKPSLSGEEPVEVSDFIESFEKKTPSFDLDDEALRKKDKDSLLISVKVFTQFIPDSVIKKVFGKTGKPKIYPMARIEAGNEETYLFAKAVQGEKRVAYLLVMDEKNNFRGYMDFLKPDTRAATRQSASMDRRFTINQTTSVRQADGTFSDRRDVFVFNSETGQFMLIMTDAPDNVPKDIINPIDTLPKKHRFSADYVRDKKNFVSIRDGARPDRFVFFIHFERNNGECTGEIKGTAKFTSSTVAEYREAGVPCALRFNFTSSRVTLTEIESCGSHRGVKCSFNAAYPRKREVKKKK